MATAKNKGGRPPKYKSAEELDAKIDEYFSIHNCKENAPKWHDMLNFLNVSDDTLLNYRKSEAPKYRGFAEVIKKAERKHCSFWQQCALDHPNLQSFCMFELKQPHNGGFSDKQQVDNKQDIKIDFCINGTQIKPYSSN